MEWNSDKQRKESAYFVLGRAYQEKEQFQRAIGNFEKSWEISKELGKKKEETKVLYELGNTCLLNNQNETAIEYFKKALKIAMEQGYKQSSKTLEIFGSRAYNPEEKFQTPIEFLEKALRKAMQQEYKKEETRTFFELQIADKFKNIFKIASEEHLEKALKIAIEQEDKVEEIHVLCSMGANHQSDYQFQKAIQYYQKALQIAERQEGSFQGNLARNSIQTLSLIIGKRIVSLSVVFKTSLVTPRCLTDFLGILLGPVVQKPVNLTLG